MRFGQMMVYILIGIWLAAIITSIGLGVLMPMRPSTDLATAVLWSLFGAMLPATICALAMDRGATWWLSASGIAAAGAGWLIAVTLFAMHYSLSEMDVRLLSAVAAGLGAWSLTAGLSASLMTMPTVRWWERLLRGAVIAMLFLLFAGACALSAAVAIEPLIGQQDFDELVMILARVVGSIATFFGIALIGLIASYYERKLRGEETAMSDRRPFGAMCPRCGEAQELHTGGDHCRECGLKITVNVA